MDGRPPRTRRVAHKRESMDLDEVMGASDDDLDAFPQPPKSATRSFSKANHKPSTPSQLSNGKPYISKAAKELIDFLDEGPPEETQLPPSNPSMISFQSGKTKSGRFQRMISRLTLGGSRENLNGANLLDNGMRNGRMGNRVQRTSSTTVPPPSYFPSSLSSKRSMPNVIIAAPPRLPLPPHPPSPPSSSQASTEDVPGTHSASSPSRRLSIARKAVPTFDDNSETPPVPRVPADDAEVKAPLSRTPSSSAVLRPMNGTGHAKSVSVREYMDHRKDAAHKLEGTATSIASDRTLTENASPSTPTLHITSASTTSGTGSRKSIPRVAASEKEAAGAPKQPVVKENKETSTSETYISVSDLADMRRLLSAATNADECRLIVDMFLARNGVVSPPAPGAIGKRILPPPRHPRHHHRPSAFVAEMRAQNEVLERSLVAALLGSDDEGLCASSSSETEIVSSSSSDNLSERDNVKPPLV